MMRRTQQVFLAALLVAASVLSHAHESRGKAAPPVVHFSYEAVNLAPADYLNRALPPITPGSTVRIAATIFTINESGGTTFFDPAAYDYQWYLNSRFVAGGRGTAAVTVTVDRGGVSEPRVRLRLSDSRGNFIRDAEITLPLARPSVAVLRQAGGATALAETPLTAAKNSTLTLVAKPYFFSIPSADLLHFVWKQEGAPITGPITDPKILRIAVPADAEEKSWLFSIAVSDTSNPTENVQKNFNITVH